MLKSTKKLDHEILLNACLCVAEYSKITKKWDYFLYKDMATGYEHINEVKSTGRSATYTNYGIVLSECNMLNAPL